MSANKIVAGFFLCFSQYVYALPIQKCIGPICVLGKENFYQFKTKWKAYQSPRIPTQSNSYPSLCLWNKNAKISYIFDFIGHYGTTDEALSHTWLGTITIARTSICRKENLSHLPSSLDEGIVRWIGRDKKELIEVFGAPSRIDDGKNSYVFSRELDMRMSEIYVYKLDGENEILFNAFGIDGNDKIVQILISEAP